MENEGGKVVKVVEVGRGAGQERAASEKPRALSRERRLPAWLVLPPGSQACSIADLSDEELYKKCRECGQNAKEWSRRFAALLPEVVKRGLHRRKGFVSIGEFAGKIAGMSEYAVDRILQLHAKIKDKPFLLKLFESAAEGWSKVEVVAYVATAETDKLWAEKIPLLSQAALSELVKNYRLKSPVNGRSQSLNLFSQGAAACGVPGSGGDGNLGLYALSGGMNGSRMSAMQDVFGPIFEPPVRFSFPASREVEFDLRLAKQKLEKQTKQVLSWNETFQLIIQKSEIANGKEKGENSARDESLCKNCLKKAATKHVCDECYQKSVNGLLSLKKT